MIPSYKPSDPTDAIAKDTGIILLSSLSYSVDFGACYSSALPHYAVLPESGGRGKGSSSSKKKNASESSKKNADENVRIVQHTYLDHALCAEHERPINTGGGVKAPFPVKLYEMMEHIDLRELELSSIISWQPHGRCFKIRDVKAFEESVLPRFFVLQKKFASFRRQLNLYGFKRLTQGGPDCGCYYHELFLRSKRFLCRGIVRISPGGQGKRVAGSNPDDEPSFFRSMIALPPSTEESKEVVLSSTDVVTSILDPPKIVSMNAMSYSSSSRRQAMQGPFSTKILFPAIETVALLATSRRQETIQRHLNISHGHLLVGKKIPQSSNLALTSRDMLPRNSSGLLSLNIDMPSSCISSKKNEESWFDMQENAHHHQNQQDWDEQMFAKEMVGLIQSEILLLPPLKTPRQFF